MIVDIDDATGSFSTTAFLTNNPLARTLSFTVADTAIGGGINAATDIVVTSSVSGVLVASCTPAVAFPTTADEVVTCTVDISAE